MGAPTAGAPRPPRRQPTHTAHATLPSRPPRRQPPPTARRRAAEPAAAQRGLDHRAVHPYRQHRCTPMHQDGPSVSAKTRGRAVAYPPDVVTLASHTTAGNDQPTPNPARHHDQPTMTRPSSRRLAINTRPSSRRPRPARTRPRPVPGSRPDPGNPPRRRSLVVPSLANPWSHARGKTRSQVVPSPWQTTSSKAGAACSEVKKCVGTAKPAPPRPSPVARKHQSDGAEASPPPVTPDYKRVNAPVTGWHRSPVCSTRSTPARAWWPATRIRSTRPASPGRTLRRRRPGAVTALRFDRRTAT